MPNPYSDSAPHAAKSARGLSCPFPPSLPLAFALLEFVLANCEHVQPHAHVSTAPIPPATPEVMA